MELVSRRSRGQAIPETAIMTPVILITLFGVIWAAQYGVMNERVQSAVRYSGLISNQIDPFNQYSMYVLYNSVGNPSNSPIPAQTCNPPGIGALNNTGEYPGPESGPFWQATPAPVATACNASTSGQSSVAEYQTGMNEPVLALSNLPSVTAQVVVPNFLQPLFGGLTELPTSAQMNFLRPIDMSTMLSCYPGIQNVLEPSLQPTPQAITLATSSPIPEPMASPTYPPISTCPGPDV